MPKDYRDYNLPPELLASDTGLSRLYVQFRERLYQLESEGKTPENNEGAARCADIVEEAGQSISVIVGLRAELLEMKAHLVMLNSENHILHDYMQKHRMKMALQAGMEKEINNWKTMKRVYPTKA